MTDLPTPVVIPNATVVSLDLPPDLTFDQWYAYLTYVRTVEVACHWWLGDLLNGAAQRGFEHQAIQAAHELGFSDQTCANAKSVCGRLPKERRRLGLTYSHHAAAAYLEPEQADEVLETAERERWLVRDVQEEVKRIRGVALPAKVEADEDLRKRVGDLCRLMDGFLESYETIPDAAYETARELRDALDVLLRVAPRPRDV